MLGHRLRRWPNINPTLDQCVGESVTLQIYLLDRKREQFVMFTNLDSVLEFHQHM